MSPIRVLELRSVAGTGGGPDKTLLASARRNDANVQLTLCYFCNEGDDVFKIGDEARRLGVDYIEIRERGAIDRRAWQEARALVRKGRYDIIHGHEYKTDLFAFLLARAEHRIPFATAHGWTGHSWKERAIYYPADKRLLARFPRVAAVSTEIKETLVRSGGQPDRIDVVLNGIDHLKFRRDNSLVKEARAALNIPEDAVAIGSVGRLEPQKRFDLLIKSFAEVQRGFPTARLLIAGDGSLKETLTKQIAEMRLGDRVRLVGHVDVIPFHHALDLFVQSSAYEGTPNVVLEAMALETPIVATDVGGTAELAFDGRHALIIPSGDIAALTTAIQRCLADPIAARARAKAARERVETDLSFDRRMARIDEIYAGLIASNASTSPSR